MDTTMLSYVSVSVHENLALSRDVTVIVILVFEGIRLAQRHSWSSSYLPREYPNSPFYKGLKSIMLFVAFMLFFWFDSQDDVFSYWFRMHWIINLIKKNRS